MSESERLGRGNALFLPRYCGVSVFFKGEVNPQVLPRRGADWQRGYMYWLSIMTLLLRITMGGAVFINHNILLDI